MTIEDLTRETVEKLLADITDRRGWRQEWDQFDDDVRAEIREAFGKIVAAALAEAGENGCG